MPTLKELVENKKLSEGLSYEKMARIADISRNQLNIVLENGISDGTTYKTICGFAKLLGMRPWELLKLIDDETNR